MSLTQQRVRQAVYYYTHEGRGPCFAFDGMVAAEAWEVDGGASRTNGGAAGCGGPPGQKELATWFRSYLILAGRDAKLTEAQRASGLQTVNIYDIKNKLVGPCAGGRARPLPLRSPDCLSVWACSVHRQL